MSGSPLNQLAGAYAQGAIGVVDYRVARRRFLEAVEREGLDAAVRVWSMDQALEPTPAEPPPRPAAPNPTARRHRAMIAILPVLLLGGLVLAVLLFSLRGHESRNPATLGEHSIPLAGQRPAAPAGLEVGAAGPPERSPGGPSPAPATVHTPVASAPVPGTGAASGARSSPALVLDDEVAGNRWLRQQVPRNYTVQLHALSSREGAAGVVRRFTGLGLQWVELNAAPPPYRILWGSFADPRQAHQAFATLPEPVRATVARPVVRKFSALQSLLEGRSGPSRGSPEAESLTPAGQAE